MFFCFISWVFFYILKKMVLLEWGILYSFWVLERVGFFFIGIFDGSFIFFFLRVVFWMIFGIMGVIGASLWIRWGWVSF